MVKNKICLKLTQIFHCIQHEYLSLTKYFLLFLYIHYI